MKLKVEYSKPRYNFDPELIWGTTTYNGNEYEASGFSHEEVNRRLIQEIEEDMAFVSTDYIEVGIKSNNPLPSSVEITSYKRDISGFKHLPVDPWSAYTKVNNKYISGSGYSRNDAIADLKDKLRKWYKEWLSEEKQTVSLQTIIDSVNNEG